jgi:hypothetical protein
MNIEKSRVGSFFVIIGLVLLMIFFFTDQAKYPSFGYFASGGALLFLGGYLWWSDRKPPVESSRFRALRRARQKRAERKARKQKKLEEQRNSEQVPRR